MKMSLKRLDNSNDASQYNLYYVCWHSNDSWGRMRGAMSGLRNCCLCFSLYLIMLGMVASWRGCCAPSSLLEALEPPGEEDRQWWLSQEPAVVWITACCGLLFFILTTATSSYWPSCHMPSYPRKEPLGRGRTTIVGSKSSSYILLLFATGIVPSQHGVRKGVQQIEKLLP